MKNLYHPQAYDEVVFEHVGVTWTARETVLAALVVVAAVAIWWWWR